MTTNGTFAKNVMRYRDIDPNGTIPVEKIAAGLGWSRNTSYIFKYFISELSADELILIDQIVEQIDLEIIKAISLLQPESRAKIWTHIPRILQAPSSFVEIDRCIEEAKGHDLLIDIRPKYWLCVGEYLQQRNMNHYPFTKNAIYFINSIGFNGYTGLSNKQKDWIYDLIDKDKKRPDHDRFFINEHVLNKGFSKECAIIKQLRSSY